MAISGKLRWISRSFTTLVATPLRICVVGSGPAGFYTAEKGVAPDHPETKIVINQFSRIAQNDRCSFIGNVSVGSSVSLPELREMYNAVVLAYGAESDRTLGIPGELDGIYAAREFVWWYNGHPDCRNLAPDLKSTDTAVILDKEFAVFLTITCTCYYGNVAFDVARILLRPTMELARADIASHALVALEESSIRKVYLVGRRGPVQAACTAKELREVLGIKDLSIHVKQTDLVTTPADEVEMKDYRIRRRVYELISKAASSGPSLPLPSQRELHLVFFKPDRFLESDDRSGNVVGVRLEETTLRGDDLGEQIAVVCALVACRLVLKSIGYKSVAIDSLPFDHYKGRVLANSSGDVPQYETSLYVCGWLKRGPTGIIATNLYCAEETVASIFEDIGKGVQTSDSAEIEREGLLQLLEGRNIKAVQFDDWEKIDAEEKKRGKLKNKPREKLATWEELLQVVSE
ncbi:NADPH:adrenodoxin oxidoreductase, mitochondrial [Olea europaea subsp. europaea]|uniref:NADPH:adrenodoxin oxidoreductase, mitochondrial n=1 Tax=Olea europaea subsp. europaea TaxID=158383 RepID=A0A8S0VCK6_OLEEU|nr:NADPH:adrenodoxin oxidoreductase, mitochondrial [Olea europaea subsp. europaea]